MLFSDFFKNLNLNTSTVDEFFLSKEISLMCQDSNKIKENAVFFAIQGKSFNGADFILNAQNKCFISLIDTKNPKAKEFVNSKNVILVENIDKIAKKAVNLLYALQPKHKLAVTGTNGKSSIVCFIRQMLGLLNYSSASVGTLGFFINNNLIEETLTTPSSLDLARYANFAKQQNIDFLALETSSHGILQNRIENVSIDVAAFINLTQDHLDYHKNMENYYNAKKLLFTKFLNSPKKMVVNIDDPYGLRLVKDIVLQQEDEVISYGKNASSKLVIKEIKTFTSYQHVYLSYLGKDYNFKINMLGEFQVYNVLCATCMLLLTNCFSLEQIIKTLEYIKPEKGRLEFVANYKNSLIYVDYAHTPSALEAVLSSLKKDLKGNLHVVFGCGGNRDALKRPQMGKIAYSLANYVYVTDDNPRKEDKNLIRQDILSFDKTLKVKELFKNDIKNIKKQNIDNLQDRVFNIETREDAIVFAMLNLKKNDILLIAGKGHEQYQIIGDKKYNFSDYEVVNKTINNNN